MARIWSGTAGGKIRDRTGGKVVLSAGAGSLQENQSMNRTTGDRTRTRHSEASLGQKLTVQCAKMGFLVVSRVRGSSEEWAGTDRGGGALRAMH